MKLVGDIGGTKTLLALADPAGNLSCRRRLASADFHDFPDLLADYLNDVDFPHGDVCLAVAGPIADDGRSAKITNLPWSVDAAALEARFGFARVALINDFAAVAAGVSVLAPQALLTLQAGQVNPAGLRLILGPGTGLGVAALIGDRILPSEAGHIGFAPADESQARLHAALLTRYGRVTAERVISGPGLTAIHQLLTGEAPTPAAIGERALTGEPVALRTVETFFACFGAFAGDMALSFMAVGGVYLAGGVTQRLLPLLPASGFLTAFNDKAEHAQLAHRMPVFAIAEPDVGLRGAACMQHN